MRLTKAIFFHRFILETPISDPVQHPVLVRSPTPHSIHSSIRNLFKSLWAPVFLVRSSTTHSQTAWVRASLLPIFLHNSSQRCTLLISWKRHDSHKLKWRKWDDDELLWTKQESKVVRNIPTTLRHWTAYTRGVQMNFALSWFPSSYSSELPLVFQHSLPWHQYKLANDIRVLRSFRKIRLKHASLRSRQQPPWRHWNKDHQRW